MADKAEERGLVSIRDYRDLLNADLIIRGRSRETAQDVYLVAGVSFVVDSHDVERAARRARIVARIVDVPVIAAVGGTRLTTDAEQDAARLGVRQVLHDGDAAET